jgi:hypothetical protein
MAEYKSGDIRPMRVKLYLTKLSFMIAGVALASAPAWAHHAFAAEFDANKPVKLQGTVTKMEWINPHAWIHMDVKNADGTVTNWMIECGAPNGLLRRGFTKQSLPPGTQILVTGWQAKDGSNRANGSDLTFADGRKLFVGSSNTGAPYENKGESK